jgi:hypothetical protein
MAFAGALLWTACGCSGDAFLSPFTVMPYGPKTVAAGSVSRVCNKLQDGLTEAGLMVRTNRVGSDVRLVSIAKSGKVFCLHLRAQGDMGGKKTLVHVQWDRGGDEELWQLVLKILATPAPGAEDASSVGLSLKDEG